MMRRFGRADAFIVAGSCAAAAAADDDDDDDDGLDAGVALTAGATTFGAAEGPAADDNEEMGRFLAETLAGEGTGVFSGRTPLFFSFTFFWRMAE